MSDYESRINRIRTTIRACLDSHDEDEGFFSANDDDSDDSPPRSSRDHDQTALEEKDKINISAADSTAACSSPAGALSDAATADDGQVEAEARWSALPAAHHDSGPTSQTEHKTRAVSTSNSTLMAGPPHNGNAKHLDRAGASYRRETTEEPEPSSCVAGRSNASNNVDDAAGEQNVTAATKHEPCGIVSFAGVSVSGLRLIVKVSHRQQSLKTCTHEFCCPLDRDV